MKGFEVGKSVRLKVKIVLLDGQTFLPGSIHKIVELIMCCQENPSICVGWKRETGEGSHCGKCKKPLSNAGSGLVFKSCSFFEPIDDDEIEIQSDTFKQVTFTKIIEKVPAGVN